MPLYSIILPVYNVEKYLAECLDSILAQNTALSYEVILVDDGSTDGSGAICDAYASRYEHFSVLHIPNGGVSNARNTGLGAAKGTYVVFCDPDDLYDQALFATLSPLVESRPDMVVFCCQLFSQQGQGSILRPDVLPQGEKGINFLTRCFQSGSYPPVSSCQYLYRRGFLYEHHLRYQTDFIAAEDMNFVLESLSAASSVTGTEQILYHYRIHEGSNTTTPSVRKQTDKLLVHTKWARRFPCPATANSFCRVLLAVSDLGTRREVQPLIELYRQNRDILASVSEWETRVARTLFRIFGLYYGSVIIMTMIRVRHRVMGIS